LHCRLRLNYPASRRASTALTTLVALADFGGRTSGTTTGSDQDAALVLARAKQQEVKDELRRNSEEAVERGAFGAPTFFIGDEMFWGNDRLDFVEEALRAARS
jgi:protein-disulfide isomerase